MQIAFTIEGPPVAKARPRVSFRHGRAWAYTPSRTADYEERVREAALDAFKRPLLGPLVADVTLGMPIPASWSRLKRALAAQGDIAPTGRPDLDNLSKGILDALNGIAYKDDSQVVRLTAEKVYATRPCVRVVIAEKE